MPKHSYYIRIVQRFFALKATNPKNIAHMVLSAILRVSTYLLVPFMASKIIGALEIGDENKAFI